MLSTVCGDPWLTLPSCLHSYHEEVSDVVRWFVGQVTENDIVLHSYGLHDQKNQIRILKNGTHQKD